MIWKNKKRSKPYNVLSLYRNLEGKKYNMDKAKRYHNQMLGKNSEYNTSKKSRWLMARRIVKHWTEVFAEANI